MQLPVQNCVPNSPETGTNQQQNILSPRSHLSDVQIQQPVLQTSSIPFHQTPHYPEPEIMIASQPLQPQTQQLSTNDESTPSKTLLENKTSLKRTEDKMASEDVKIDVDTVDFGERIVIIKKHKLKKTTINLPKYPANHYSKESEVKKIPGIQKKSPLLETLKE